MGFIKRLFPCFFSTEEAPVEEAPVQGPLPTALLDERVAIAIHHVEGQLQIRNTDKIIQGLYPNAIYDGKVAVILKYNNAIELFTMHLHDYHCLGTLKHWATIKIEDLMRERNNREVQTADFSITTIALNNFDTAHDGTKFVPISALHRQGCNVTFNPNNRSNSTWRFDVKASGRCTQEEVMKDIKRYTTSPQIQPELSRHLQGAIESFFYNQ